MTRKVRATGRMADYATAKLPSSVLLGDVQKHVMSKTLADHERRTDIIHPSEMAKSNWCERATYYRMKGLVPKAEKFNFVRQNIFAEGDTIHSKWQLWFQEMGRLWGTWQCNVCKYKTKGLVQPPGRKCPKCEVLDVLWVYKEVPLQSSDYYMIAGHADGIVDKKLIEIKSVGIGTIRYEIPELLKKYTFKLNNGRTVYDVDGLWKDLNRPLFSHIKQGMIYAYLCVEMGYDVDEIVFIYENKMNQQVKEFSVKLDMEIVVTELLDKAHNVVVSLENNTPPFCEGCSECKAYEDEDGSKSSAEEDTDGRRVSTLGTGSKRTTRRSEKLSEPSTTPARRKTRASKGSDGSRRLRSDVVDESGDSVVKLHERATESSTNRREGRRVTRRKV